MKHPIITTALTVAALTLTTPSPAHAAGAESQGGGHNRFGFIDCYSPSQVVVHGFFQGNVRLAVKDPINGQNFKHATYKWSRFTSDPTPDGARLEWHAADMDGLDGHAWVGRAFASCDLIV